MKSRHNNLTKSKHFRQCYASPMQSEWRLQVFSLPFTLHWRCNFSENLLWDCGVNSSSRTKIGLKILRSTRSKHRSRGHHILNSSYIIALLDSSAHFFSNDTTFKKNWPYGYKVNGHLKTGSHAHFGQNGVKWAWRSAKTARRIALKF